MRSLALFGVTLVLAAACGDPLGLLPAAISNRTDTVSLYALSGTAIAQPSAYEMIVFRRAVRTDQVAEFDFAFEIDSAGRALLLPTGALHLGRASGIQTVDMPFDSVRFPPNGNYQLDSAVVVDSNDVAVIHSRTLTCSFGLAAVLFAKLHVLAIDTTSGPNGRRIDFEILANYNCGYRGLEPGLPLQ